MYQIEKHLVGDLKDFYLCGYYKIYHINKPNKYYVGSAFSTKRHGSMSGFLYRLSQHFVNLKYNNHINKKLQNVTNKYGIDGLRFEIIEITSDCHSRNLRELYWINHFDTIKNGYNLTTETNVHFPVMTPESLKKMGEKVSQKHKGKIPKNLVTMRKSRWRPVVEYRNGEKTNEYVSTTEAGRQLGIDHKIIHNYLTGKSKQCKKYPDLHWEYKDGLPPIKFNYNEKSNWRKWKESTL